MTLWTPGGEHPVDRGGQQPPSPPPPTAGAPGARGAPPLRGGGRPGRGHAAELAEARARLLEAPASVVVANHAMGLYELAAIHLTAESPRLPDAVLAIDALAALVEGLAGRLGDAEPTLREALDQLRIAYVQVRGAGPGGSGSRGARPHRGVTHGTVGRPPVRGRPDHTIR
jgi:hypothetical protein